MKYLATENIPTWAVCYIEYGNDCADGLTDEEIKMVDDFLNSYGCGLVFEYSEEQFFTSSPAFGLPCDCVEANIYQA